MNLTNSDVESKLLGILEDVKDEILVDEKEIYSEMSPHFECLMNKINKYSYNIQRENFKVIHLLIILYPKGQGQEIFKKQKDWKQLIKWLQNEQFCEQNKIPQVWRQEESIQYFSQNENFLKVLLEIISLNYHQQSFYYLEMIQYLLEVLSISSNKNQSDRIILDQIVGSCLNKQILQFLEFKEQLKLFDETQYNKLSQDIQKVQLQESKLDVSQYDASFQQLFNICTEIYNENSILDYLRGKFDDPELTISNLSQQIDYLVIQDQNIEEIYFTLTFYFLYQYCNKYKFANDVQKLDSDFQKLKGKIDRKQDVPKRCWKKMSVINDEIYQFVITQQILFGQVSNINEAQLKEYLKNQLQFDDQLVQIDQRTDIMKQSYEQISLSLKLFRKISMFKLRMHFIQDLKFAKKLYLIDFLQQEDQQKLFEILLNLESSIFKTTQKIEKYAQHFISIKSALYLIYLITELSNQNLQLAKFLVDLYLIEKSFVKGELVWNVYLILEQGNDQFVNNQNLLNNLCQLIPRDWEIIQKLITIESFIKWLKLLLLIYEKTGNSPQIYKILRNASQSLLIKPKNEHFAIQFLFSDPFSQEIFDTIYKNQLSETEDFDSNISIFLEELRLQGPNEQQAAFPQKAEISLEDFNISLTELSEQEKEEIIKLWVENIQSCDKFTSLISFYFNIIKRKESFSKFLSIINKLDNTNKYLNMKAMFQIFYNNSTTELQFMLLKLWSNNYPIPFVYLNPKVDEIQNIYDLYCLNTQLFYIIQECWPIINFSLSKKRQQIGKTELVNKVFYQSEQFQIRDNCPLNENTIEIIKFAVADVHGFLPIEILIQVLPFLKNWIIQMDSEDEFNENLEQVIQLSKHIELNQCCFIIRNSKFPKDKQQIPKIYEKEINMKKVSILKMRDLTEKQLNQQTVNQEIQKFSNFIFGNIKSEYLQNSKIEIKSKSKIVQSLIEESSNASQRSSKITQQDSKIILNNSQINQSDLKIISSNSKILLQMQEKQGSVIQEQQQQPSKIFQQQSQIKQSSSISIQPQPNQQSSIINQINQKIPSQLKTKFQDRNTFFVAILQHENFTTNSEKASKQFIEENSLLQNLENELNSFIQKNSVFISKLLFLQDRSVVQNDELNKDDKSIRYYDIEKIANNQKNNQISRAYKIIVPFKFSDQIRKQMKTELNEILPQKKIRQEMIVKRSLKFLLLQSKSIAQMKLNFILYFLILYQFQLIINQSGTMSSIKNYPFYCFEKANYSTECKRRYSFLIQIYQKCQYILQV